MNRPELRKEERRHFFNVSYAITYRCVHPKVTFEILLLLVRKTARSCIPILEMHCEATNFIIFTFRMEMPIVHRGRYIARNINKSKRKCYFLY